MPFLFLPSTQNRGGALACRRRPDSGALGDGGGREEKGKREGTEKVRSPSYLGLGWSVEGGPRGPAAVVLGGSGGGAREPERRSAGRRGLWWR